MASDQEITSSGEEDSRPIRHEDEIDLIDYVEVIVRRRWLIIWGIALFCAGVVLQQKISPTDTEYVAEANLVVLDTHQFDPTSGKLVPHQVSVNALHSYQVGRRVLEHRVAIGLKGRIDTIKIKDYFQNAEGT